MIPRVLAIAGSDSGGGAGIQADVRTITLMGGHAMTAVTALTAQNTVAVERVMPVPPDMVVAQIDAVVADLGIDAIKIGMLGSAETAKAVAAAIRALPLPPCAPAKAGAQTGSPPSRGFNIVLDPVMIASSGAALADDATIAGLATLMTMATLVTPNLPELAALTGRSIADERDMLAAAQALADAHDVAVLAKGGHLPGDRLVDLLVGPDGVERWEDDRIDTRHTHGTGCTLASAIATRLGAGDSLPAAIAAARAHVRAALLAAPGFGRGHGPMGAPCR